MIHGIGTDIIKIERISSSIKDPDDPFLKKTFTQSELLLIRSRTSPLYSYATRFAGKEAVFKAMKINGTEISLLDIEILEDEHGVPTVELHGNAARLFHEMKLTSASVSLSYDTDYAIAYALIEC